MILRIFLTIIALPVYYFFVSIIFFWTLSGFLIFGASVNQKLGLRQKKISSRGAERIFLIIEGLYSLNTIFLILILLAGIWQFPKETLVALINLFLLIMALQVVFLFLLGLVYGERTVRKCFKEGECEVDSQEEDFEKKRHFQEMKRDLKRMQEIEHRYGKITIGLWNFFKGLFSILMLIASPFVFFLNILIGIFDIKTPLRRRRKK